jgi:outer membrane translocation and assembly module TamA
MMVDKAKKRLQNLGFFKSVDIKRRPGSAADRIILDVDLVEQSTGELSFGAGYSTSEGIIGDVSITERNLLGGAVLAPAPGRLHRTPADRSELHRAAFSRSQPGGRLRPLPQGRQPLERVGLPDPNDRWRAAPRLPAHREFVAHQQLQLVDQRHL